METRVRILADGGAASNYDPDRRDGITMPELRAAVEAAENCHLSNAARPYTAPCARWSKPELNASIMANSLYQLITDW